MTIAIFDSCAEDRERTRQALAGAIDGPFVGIDPAGPITEDALAGVRLALVETGMPGEAGFELVQRIGVVRPDLPVVVVTRRVEADRVVAAMKAGACDYLGKDRLDRLAEVARAALSSTIPTYALLRAAVQTDRAIAHELRNVFQSIRFAADLLRRIRDEGRRGPLLHTLVSAVERGRDLLKQMLPVPHAEGHPAPPPRPPALQHERRQVILVIGDQPDATELVRHTVEERGYRWLAAPDAVEAGTLFRRHQHEIAAVLVDLTTRVLDAPAVLRDLRLVVPTLPILPVGGPAPAVDGLALRYSLPKPFTASLLIETLERLLTEEPRTWPAS